MKVLIFLIIFKESGFSLTKTEYDNLFRYFDKNCDDEVSFVEFVSFVKGIYNNYMPSSIILIEIIISLIIMGKIKLK